MRLEEAQWKRKPVIDANERRHCDPYSHSIINGACKPLIRLCDISNRAGFTVTCTVTSSGIPSCSFHHRSTSIENSRRVHDGQLSRSIEVYRALGHWQARRRTSL